MAEGPLILLSSVPGRTFIETGLVVIRDTRDRLFSERRAETDRDILNNIALHHEWVHYVQSITCSAVHYTAQELLRLSLAAVGAAEHGRVPDETHQKIRELSERLYGRRANESVRIVEGPDLLIMIPIPDSHQIGMLDLLEGVAVLESFKLCTTNADVDDFLAFRDRHFPGSTNSVYRWSFNWLAGAIGPEAAYELLGPVSFFALQTTEPEAEFVRITKLLKEHRSRDYRALTDVEALAEVAYKGDWSSWLHAFEAGEPESGHVTLDPGTTFAVGQLGVQAVTQFGATPGRVTPESFEALRPPVIVYSGEDAITLEVARYAQKGLAESVIDYTAIVGAAERLTIRAETDVYQFCPHRSTCPHFESALCHRNFAPPGVNRTHDKCRFPGALSRVANLDPSALWAAVGRERRSVNELVEEFEATGEGGLWALARRRRASIIEWLGREGYDDLEWKCEATANKALRALQTRSMNDVVEARAFRDAVVNEVRNKAAGEATERGRPTQ